MKWLMVSLFVFIFTGCAIPAETPASPQGTVSSTLPNYGAASELSKEVWLNTDQPLRLAGLQGKVVLLDMWTFC